MVAYGQCPRVRFSKGNKQSCASWIACWSFGYLCVVAFTITFAMGIYDLRKYGKVRTQGRGNWRDWGSEEALALDSPTLQTEITEL